MQGWVDLVDGELIIKNTTLVHRENGLNGIDFNSPSVPNDTTLPSESDGQLTHDSLHNEEDLSEVEA